jgi:hypothetical protein
VDGAQKLENWGAEKRNSLQATLLIMPCIFKSALNDLPLLKDRKPI